MEEMKKLEVGDVIYCNPRFSDKLYRYVIDRITATQAMAGNLRVRVKYRDPNWIQQVGGRTIYKLETEELKKIYLKQIKLYRLSEIKFYKFSLEQLTEILILIEKFEKE